MKIQMKIQMNILKSVFLAILLHVVQCKDAHRVVDLISSAIGRTVLECRAEVQFSSSVIDEFLQFWVPGHALELEEMGCVVFCVLIKLQLLEDDGALKKNNAVGFGKANGADDEIINGLIVVFEECRISTKFDMEEPCVSGLRQAACFREKVFLKHWAPKPDAIYVDDDDD